ncbi:MAG TPA: HPP family protein [Piscinibacter sp.]|jgi:CBS domain-containing membrane protein|uniref:HPP family protein n=1 Tax=Piscinibacter sp. TaxID=1903157 RepID=UPI001B40E4D6|nr:HPP family protein [Piscinibacter sp.]MBK7532903.1 HPP family protein [Piscinibacter sp.]MBP6543913.1 HPP family protein [Piscinibacter sp.]HPG79677.1 HPP family protein [Piscinibacter sp.]HPM69237.1 HPP family protein [Piscinibacter sp.]
MTRTAARALRWLAALLPATLRVDARERSRAALGAALGLLIAALASRWVGAQLAIDPWLAAPLGASAVLVFAVPASPLAQPWSVIGGNTVSVIIGMACARLVPDTALAAAVAVSAAIVAMFLLRCLHPPGGASALLAVLVHTHDPRFALLPILLNSVLLVIVGMAYNTLTGRRYPHVQTTPAAPLSPAGARFSSADLDAALVHYNQVLDVSRDDLEELLHHAEAAAYRRNLGELRCQDVMSRDPLTVSIDTPIATAWSLMRAREVKALPVVDKSHRIVGIVTLADFVRALVPDEAPPAAMRPAHVGAIMMRRVRVASEALHVIELLPLFSEGGHHHLPVVDAQQHLVGILTQSDVVRALHRAVRPD